MARHPFEADGTIRNLNGKWMIEMNEGSMNGLSEGTPVRILYWTDLPDGIPTEIETIAKAQQLDLAIVAYGLEAEGSLHEVRDAFLRRLGIVTEE